MGKTFTFYFMNLIRTFVVIKLQRVLLIKLVNYGAPIAENVTIHLKATTQK